MIRATSVYIFPLEKIVAVLFSMSKVSKIYEKLMAGHSDASMSFDDLCFLLERLGFASRQQGTSHKIFKRGEGFLNLQEGSAGKAKPYQVRQARETLKKMKLRP